MTMLDTIMISGLLVLLLCVLAVVGIKKVRQ